MDNIPTIALIANKPVTRETPDFNQIVDGHDVVARVSKMEFKRVGKTGTRTDILFLEPNTVFWSYSRIVQNMDAILRCERIYITDPKWFPVWQDKGYHGVLAPVLRDQFPFFTTASLAVMNLVHLYPDSTIDVFMDVGEERLNMLHPLHKQGLEVKVLNELLEAGKIRLIR